jgi:predicted RNA binding protein with dsRBD fold (UPF0201 family)
MQPEFSLRVSAEIHPTESEEKIRKALLSVFNGINFSRDGDSLVGTSMSPMDLQILRKKLHERKILDTARSRLLSNISGSGTALLLHKQALAAGKVAIVDSPIESPMGPVRVSIALGSPESLHDFINHLAPMTVDGAPVGERALSELGFSDA